MAVGKGVIQDRVQTSALGGQVWFVRSRVVDSIRRKAWGEAGLPLPEGVLDGVRGAFEFAAEDGDFGKLTVGDGGLELVLEGEEIGEAVDNGPESRRHAEEGVDGTEGRCGGGVERRERDKAARCRRGREGSRAEGKGSDDIVEAECLRSLSVSGIVGESGIHTRSRKALVGFELSSLPLMIAMAPLR